METNSNRKPHRATVYSASRTADDPTYMGDMIDTDCLDSEARTVAERFMNGELADMAARWEIAALVRASRIPAQVAYGKVKGNSQLAEDVSDRLDMLVERKIIGELDNGLELHLIAAGTSMCGWVRRFCQTAWRSEMSRTTCQTRHEEIGDVESYQNLTETISSDPDALREVDELKEALVDTQIQVFDARMGLNSQKRQAVHSHEAARAICQTFQLPVVRRVFAPDRRRQLVKQLDRDPSLGMRLLTSLAAGASPDPSLAVAFAEWTPDDLYRACDINGAQVCDVLVRAAVADVPPLPAAVQRALKAAVTAASDQSGWKGIAVKLTAAFVKAEADTRHEHTRGGVLVEKTSDERVAEIDDFEIFAEKAARFTDCPLGANHVEVRNWLSATADRLTTELALG